MLELMKMSKIIKILKEVTAAILNFQFKEFADKYKMVVLVITAIGLLLLAIAAWSANLL